MSTSPPEDPQHEAAERRTLVRSASLVGGLTLLSRITGLLRESIQAAYLGTDAAADAFRVAFLLPNLLRRLVGEGAIQSAFVPVYTRSLASGGPKEGRVFAEKFLLLWGAGAVVLTLLGILLAGWVVALGFFDREALENAQQVALATDLTRLLFWYLILISMVAGIQGILNAHGCFGWPAFAPVAFNLTFAGAAFLLADRLGPGREAFAMSWAVLASGVVQLIVLVPPLWALGVRPRLSNPLRHDGVREVMRLLMPGTVGAGIYQINVAVSTSIATSLGVGAASSLNYSNRLMEFVLGVFVFALSTVSLTSLSRYASAGDRSSFERTTAEVLRLAAFITLPSMVGLFVLRRPILSLLFESGRFDSASLDLTAAAFRFHVLGILFVGWNRVLVACFHAHKDLRTPVVQGALNMVLHLTLCYVLARAMGHAGIAFASTLAAAAQTAVLFAIVLRRFQGLRFPGVLRVSTASALASLVMGGAVTRLWSLLDGAAGGSKAALAVHVGTAILCGVVVYFLAARVFGLKEAGALVSLFRRKRRPAD